MRVIRIGNGEDYQMDIGEAEGFYSHFVPIVKPNNLPESER